MFGRATIRLGIGPHSSLGLTFCVCFSLDCFVLALFAFLVLGLASLVLLAKKQHWKNVSEMRYFVTSTWGIKH